MTRSLRPIVSRGWEPMLTYGFHVCSLVEFSHQVSLPEAAQPAPESGFELRPSDPTALALLPLQAAYRGRLWVLFLDRSSAPRRWANRKRISALGRSTAHSWLSDSVL